MAERYDMSFKNKELKMWFLIMGPVFIIGAIALFLNDSSSSYIQFSTLFIGLVTFYSWRFRYRKKQKKTDARG